MIYTTPESWRTAPEKRVALFGMSGLGKTHVADLLRRTGGWFHYSVDYRIGTRYMGEHIVDNFKREAMKVPFLAELLKSDSIYIGSNITFDNLDPLSTYLGKPGDPAQGGIPIEEYRRRQEQHREAEVASLIDTVRFVERGREIYGYPHFVCDTGGSICEVVEPEDPDDPVIAALTSALLLVWIKGDEAHVDELVARFDRQPKPMYYRPAELARNWADWLAETGDAPDKVDPDAFIRWSFRRVIETRQARYAALARHGITVEAADVAAIRSAADFERLVADALTKR
ncbi:ATPase [Pontivivens ytuae]|uniref:ATPase n=1 Tax=Pontivivens ytuae TaxID=2789856 RepID=A0A7S9QD73_9RHOB|nr:ATPase [Pontivivens ytuae]QPH53841.1 ATPase [Pontivivens ytuae]